MSARHAVHGRSVALRAAAAEAARRDRLAGAARALGEPARERIDEATRALVDALAGALVDAVEADLRNRLSPALAIRFHDAPAAAASLRAVGRPNDPALVAQLLRRADEHLLVLTLRRAETGLPVSESEPRDTLADHADAEIAAAARALLAAEAVRHDDALAPRLPLHELAPAALHALAWAVAAAMRGALLAASARSADEVDHAVALAVGELLGAAHHDQSATGCAVRLANLLDAQRLLDDVTIVDALSGGRALFAIAALARRARLPFETCWDIAFDRDGDQLVCALRAAGLARDEAVAVLALIHGAERSRGDEALAALAAAFDSLDAEAAEQAMALWRLVPQYRDALFALTLRA